MGFISEKIVGDTLFVPRDVRMPFNMKDNGLENGHKLVLLQAQTFMLRVQAIKDHNYLWCTTKAGT